MSDLKLLALDGEDLTVLSAHVQDSVMRMEDLTYRFAERRFVALLNRFDWRGVTARGHGKAEPQRRQSALRFEQVSKAQVQGLDLSQKDIVLSLLAIQFEETRPPGGIVTLVFAGDGGVRLEVDCVEAELRDLGAAWTARGVPTHPETRDDPDTSRDTTGTKT